MVRVVPNVRSPAAAYLHRAGCESSHFYPSLTDREGAAATFRDHWALCFHRLPLFFFPDGGGVLATFAALGLAFLLVPSRSVLRFAGRGACLQFRLSFALNGTSCAAKLGETYQQPARPWQSEGSQAPKPTLTCF